MRQRARKTETVYGHDIAPPRLTVTGALLGLQWLGPPALLFCLGLDLILGALVYGASGACVTLWCLL